MSERAPALLPIFRSANQLKLLGFLMVHSGSAFSIAEISRRTRVPQQTASRELHRLGTAGLVRARASGRNNLVEADRSSPYFPELRSLLLKAVGPADALSESIGKMSGVVEAFIFGSWARRYEGELGPPPGDIDLVVVGPVDPDEIDAACRSIGGILGLEVNAVVVSEREWRSVSSGFVRQVRTQPLVRVAP